MCNQRRSSITDFFHEPESAYAAWQEDIPAFQEQRDKDHQTAELLRAS